VRPNGKCNVPAVFRPLSSPTSLRRFGRLIGCSMKGDGGVRAVPRWASGSSNGGAPRGIVKAHTEMSRSPIGKGSTERERTHW
jgi:hypothetical protein